MYTYDTTILFLCNTPYNMNDYVLQERNTQTAGAMLKMPKP